MIVRQHESIVIRFLLVELEDYSTGAINKNPVVRVLMPGDGEDWQLPSAEIIEKKNGWYEFLLAPSFTSEPGILIVEAEADGTHVWRDLIQVLEPMELALFAGFKPIRTGSST